MSFIKRFQAALESFTFSPEDTRYVVAYSGGVDSHVLLYCCHVLKLRVRAVHVHHGLQTIADDWVEHCQTICDEMKTPLDVLYVDVNKKSGQSPEEAARNVRYKALLNSLQVGECLLTAQHLNDQAETLLLQLFRTASAAGLSAMPGQRRLGENNHLRPLLSFSRLQIEQFAEKNTLHWVEDPTNQNILFDRNFIRKDVLPIIKTRWPAIIKQLSTVASLQASNLQILEDMAAIDLASVIVASDHQAKVSFYKVISRLSISRLQKLSLARRLNVLRYWLIITASKQSAKTLSTISPTRHLLEEINSAVIYSASDAKPVLMFSTFEIRKFQHKLYLLKPPISCLDALSICPSANDDKAGNNLKHGITWQPLSTLVITALNIQIKTNKLMGKGLDKKLLKKALTISFRKGGERFHPVGRVHSMPLKKWLQEENIPPWDRKWIPLVSVNDELIAVGDFCVCQQYAVSGEEEGWLPDITVLSINAVD